MRLVERIVGVDASLTETWQALIKAEDWPTWMPVRSVDTSPPGKVDKSTSAVIRWNSGRPMSVVVTEFRPGRSFRWSGRVFGATVAYDHVATSAGDMMRGSPRLSSAAPASCGGKWLINRSRSR